MGEDKSDKSDSSVGSNSIEEPEYGCQLKILKLNNQIHELQTLIRDKTTSRGDFVFYANRLIRLVVEEGLNQLPYKTCEVITPTDEPFDGVEFLHGNCGVSIMRSGEAMEHGLRDCCRSIRIGKILIKTNEETDEAKVYYAKFPPDISRRRVLLMYPILNSGNTVIQAVRVLQEHGVDDKNILLLTLFCTPHGVETVIKEFPNITVLSSEKDPVPPVHFGQKYFGTD
ncbi:uracil phosphoribosyltransferase homolog [Lytechinus pictus]|uniref:uracil phosphoribosyltransferase homolog n=1 Tax=Lytechinus variegatus TaxID=7654 RepID=UPI001BB17090|nr:uracil phosphoribosyltransferase homolog [Lytechinus variegatus]XP_041463564.1 uracil phosphoribosyltransferase homolog [Lytechinus variegatus]XP_054753029.1 uracil phosphoribosyltransferase homolog [Lytechinus pictus]XP_054753033.1 uracil phosphoribosyltransferase homolog [Lytechinus pictus]